MNRASTNAPAGQSPAPLLDTRASRRQRGRLAAQALVTTEGGRVVCERLLVADRPFARMRGLLGRRVLPSGEGLLLKPSGSVHTFFMRFAIDVVFVDRDLTVLGVTPELPPWRTAGRRGARAVVELRAGEAARRGLRPGDRLAIVPAPGA